MENSEKQLKKKCLSCKEIKDLSLFKREPANRDGRAGKCSKCWNEHCRLHHIKKKEGTILAF